MPDSSRPQQADDGRTQVAMAERVTRVETKLEGIERDTTVIRTAVHAINGELQKIVIEMRGITDLRPRLQGVIDRERERKGAWGAVLVACSALVGAATIVGVIVTGIVLAVRERLL